MLFIKEANAEKFLSDPFFIINICYRIHLKGCMLIWETLYYYVLSYTTAVAVYRISVTTLLNLEQRFTDHTVFLQ